jgi:hypothetical protein
MLLSSLALRGRDRFLGDGEALDVVDGINARGLPSLEERRKPSASFKGEYLNCAIRALKVLPTRLAIRPSENVLVFTLWSSPAVASTFISPDSRVAFSISIVELFWQIEKCVLVEVQHSLLV